MRPVDTEGRVVITGMGQVTASGCDLLSLWRNVLGGVSTAKTVSRFDTAGTPTSIAAEMDDFDANQYMDRRVARRLHRSVQYAVAASCLAARDAELNVNSLDPERVGIIEGTTLSNYETVSLMENGFLSRGYRGVNPLSMLDGYVGAGSGEIALALGCKGPALTCSSGSASGNDAIGYAFDLLKADQADVMIAGGAEAPLLPAIWSLFCFNKVMTRHNENPAAAMRPFDKHRDGFLLGEGAGFLILEQLAHALNRHARIYAEVIGHGKATEAYHPVAPHPEGVGVCRAMQKALEQARIDKTEIGYINAHGTATTANDIVETRAIKRFFGNYAQNLKISSTKPVTGHLLGAAGALEMIICTLALWYQHIPMTRNLHEPEEECDLNYVANLSCPSEVRTVMNLSSGFGGRNACTVLRRYENPY